MEIQDVSKLETPEEIQKWETLNQTLPDVYNYYKKVDEISELNDIPDLPVFNNQISEASKVSNVPTLNWAKILTGIGILLVISHILKWPRILVTRNPLDDDGGTSASELPPNLPLPKPPKPPKPTKIALAKNPQGSKKHLTQEEFNEVKEFLDKEIQNVPEYLISEDIGTCVGGNNIEGYVLKKGCRKPIINTLAHNIWSQTEQPKALQYLIDKVLKKWPQYKELIHYNCGWMD